MTLVLVSQSVATKRRNEKKCMAFDFVMVWQLLQESLCTLGKSARIGLETFAIDVLHQAIE